ncbi:enoyl-ACP reductase FabI [Candidatus Hydrogenosomobacter endosymbioticus]|nr:SDR family oxidoreductase [Candidatus Hydrogenosomobacter endosymbioticus]
MSLQAGILQDKVGVIFGIANSMSIAWGITENAFSQGAKLILTYQNEAIKKRIEPLAKQVNAIGIFECDVLNEARVDTIFEEIGKKFGKIDFIVHSIAFSDKDELRNEYLYTSRENFNNTLEISCFSFTDIARASRNYLSPRASLLTMSYYGAEKVVPHYNCMAIAKAALEASVMYIASDLGSDGVRVNAISAGPIKTLAASGIGDFRHILRWNQNNSALRRNVTIDDVGKAAVFLLSDMASGITGEILHVDCGYHIVGMKMIDTSNVCEEV